MGVGSGRRVGFAREGMNTEIAVGGARPRRSKAARRESRPTVMIYTKGEFVSFVYCRSIKSGAVSRARWSLPEFIERGNDLPVMV